MEKGETSPHMAVDAVHKRSSMQWMQYAVHIGHSGIVVYGGGDIVFGAKKVSGHSGIVVYCGGDIVFGVKRSNQWT